MHPANNETMPTKIALIADIHGNLAALDVVLDDIAARGIDTIYCLGDIVGKGPDTVEVLEKLRPLCQVIIRGNWEDVLAHREYHPERMQYFFQQLLDSEQLSWMGQLPLHHDFYLSGNLVRLVHSTPQELHYIFETDRTYDDWLAMFGPSDLLPADLPEADFIFFAHIHRPMTYNLFRDGKQIVNVGSIGNSVDGVTLATYTILEGVIGTQEAAPYSVQMIRLPYDVDKTLARARAVDLPDFRLYEIELREGIYRGLDPSHQQRLADLRKRGLI